MNQKFQLIILIILIKNEKALKLFEIYSVNIWTELIKAGHKIKFEEFEELYKKRASEYHNTILHDYNEGYIKYIEKAGAHKYCPKLGMAFSIIITGHKNPFLAMRADWEFALKLKHFYKNFLKDLMDKYEIVL